MSFLIDPPLLFLSGLALYFGGKGLDWNCRSKIVVGVAITLTFIVFSTLLYADIIRCVFPFFSSLTGSEFMFHTNITGNIQIGCPAGDRDNPLLALSVLALCRLRFRLEDR